MSKMNPVVHFEMPTEDQNRIAKFYTAVFGWKTMKLGAEMGEYVLVTTTESDENEPKRPGAINGGFYIKRENWPAQYPSLVIAVEDIRESMKRVTESGGKVLGELMEIPEVGQYVSFFDTEGNRVSMLQPVGPMSEARISYIRLQLTKEPVAKAEMLIRKPAAEVFEAFVNPEITTRFWFTKSSGRLEAGKSITWTWEMYNHAVPVDVKEVIENKRILIEWGNYGSMTIVEWVFTPYETGATYVSITNSGFKGDGDEIVKAALDSKGGFTWVLTGLKALLEHNIELNAIADAFPKGLRDH